MGKLHIRNRVIMAAAGVPLFAACAYALAVIFASLEATATNAMMQALLRETSMTDLAPSSMMAQLDPAFQATLVTHNTPPVWELVTAPGLWPWFLGLAIASAITLWVAAELMDSKIAVWVRAAQTA